MTKAQSKPRRSAAVAPLEAGVHIKAAADLLGHSSISITGDIYGHTTRHRGVQRRRRVERGGSDCKRFVKLS